MSEAVEAEILANDNCKEIVATGEIIDEKSTMDEVIDEADQKNSEHIARDLQALGAAYIEAKNTIEKGKLEVKSILDEAKEIGITKEMIETYVGLKQLNNLNKFAVWGAINDEESGK